MSSFDWLKKYHLFLFDFDGLLVNTEELHYKAYIRMCENRNLRLQWDFYYYAQLAHRSATGVRDQLYEQFPELNKLNWNILYEEKKNAFLQILEEGATSLMPGVKEFLIALNEFNIPSCVVTNSATLLTQVIRKQNPILDSIPHWITRENYSNPKPSPECYQVAIDRFAKEKDLIIGFEDSPRGFAALQGTRAHPVLICPPQYPYLNEILRSKIHYYPNFAAINNENHPEP